MKRTRYKALSTSDDVELGSVHHHGGSSHAHQASNRQDATQPSSKLAVAAAARAAESAGPNKDGSSQHMKFIRTLLPYLWPRGEFFLRVRVVLALVCLVLAKLCNVLVPQTYKIAVDSISSSDGHKPTFPAGAVIAYGVLRLLASALGDIRSALFINVTQNARRNISLDVFRHLHSLSLKFHIGRKTGTVLRAMERGTSSLNWMLTFLLFNILPLFLEIFMVCGILFASYEPWFAVITLATVTCYITFTLSVTEWRTRFRREMNEHDNEATNKSVDSLINFETVKYFCNEEHEAHRFDAALQRYNHSGIKAQNSLAFLNIGQGAIIAAGLTGVMMLAALRVVQGRDGITVGDFVLVNIYIIQLYAPLGFLGSSYRMVKSSLVDLEKLFQLLTEPRDIQDVPGARDLQPGAGVVEFRDVCFAYNADNPVLRGVSFKVPAGKLVAIVGESGAGKTTISRLLYRFYDVSSGAVLIDDQDVSQVTQTTLRSAIGIVPQDTVLFNDTIGYNISYGRPSASRAEIEEAAKLAQIHDFVMRLPEQYDTKVGERGLRLSGGEKQRVAIARAILKNPRVMVFDEATSALDSNTEREIQEALAKVSRGRTTITVAHRLGTIMDADEIIVLKSGEVAERGTHNDLLAIPNGVYQEMWRRQQEASGAVPAEEGVAAAATAGDPPAVPAVLL